MSENTKATLNTCILSFKLTSWNLDIFQHFVASTHLSTGLDPSDCPWIPPTDRENIHGCFLLFIVYFKEIIDQDSKFKLWNFFKIFKYELISKIVFFSSDFIFGSMFHPLLTQPWIGNQRNLCVGVSPNRCVGVSMMNIN